LNILLYANQNQLDYETLREIDHDGRTWLVINGVPIVEGVLGQFLVPYEEFGAFPADWNDVPLVLNHPVENNGSARVSSPDVPVIGRFHNAGLDPQGRRLTGEYWLDKINFLATDDGPAMYEKMRLGQPIEVSTGYFAPGTQFVNGIFKGKQYTGIHKGIHPDHIAILPSNIGNCSVMDGCGLNRNSADGIFANCGDSANCNKADCPMRDKNMGIAPMHKMEANMTGSLPAGGKKIYEQVYKELIKKGKSKESASKQAWGAVKAAGWHMGEGGKWMMQNEASPEDHTNSAMISLMIPDQLKADLQKAYPFMDDVTRDNLHITICYLGDVRTLDKEAAVKALLYAASNVPPIKAKLQGLARFVNGDEKDPIVLTFDSPQLMTLYRKIKMSLNDQKIPYHDEHGFIPHMTIGYVGKDEKMPIDTIEPLEINFSEMTLTAGATMIPATLSGYTGGDSYINSKQSANQLRGWLANATHFTKEFLMKNAQLAAFLKSIGFKNVKIEDNGTDGLSVELEGQGSETALDGLVQLNSVVQSVGGATEFTKTFEALKGLPEILANMQTQMNEKLAIVQNVASFAESVAEKEKATKTALIAGLVANKANPFDEAVLNTMSVTVLEKLNASYQPVDYSGLGAGVFSNVESKPLAVPQGYLSLFQNAEGNQTKDKV